MQTKISKILSMMPVKTMMKIVLTMKREEAQLERSEALTKRKDLKPTYQQKKKKQKSAVESPKNEAGNLKETKALTQMMMKLIKKKRLKSN